jgi:DNA-binding NarL/FixJ family response regulator
MDRFRFRVPFGSLSTRQWEILTRLVRGERVQDIADALYLSPATVRNHLTAVYRKFGVHSQAELLARLLNPAD